MDMLIQLSVMIMEHMILHHLCEWIEEIAKQVMRKGKRHSVLYDQVRVKRS